MMGCRKRGGGRAEEARARAGAYEWLALGFSPPSAEMIEALADTSAHLFSLGLEEIGWLQPFEPNALIPEYHRLFVGPGGLPAPPYESVYREGWRVMGETTLEVQRQYEEAGYALDPSISELPDHVAGELAFMALLAEEEAKAWETGAASVALSWLRREEAFLKDHLARWVPAFCDRVQASTKLPFYQGLASLLRDFTLLDLERSRALTGALEEALA